MCQPLSTIPVDWWLKHRKALSMRQTVHSAGTGFKPGVDDSKKPPLMALMPDQLSCCTDSC